MPAKPLMSWNKSQRRWEKMFKGNRLWVTCTELGLPADKHNKEDSCQAANAWWEKKAVELHAVKFARHPHASTLNELADRIDVAKALGLHREVEKVQGEKERVEKLPATADTFLDDFTVQAVKDFERYAGVSLAGVDDTVLRSFFSRNDVWRDRERRVAAVSPDKSVSGNVEKWLGERQDEARAGIRSNENADALRRHLYKFRDFIGGANTVECITVDLWHRWFVHCAGMVAKRDKDVDAGWSPDTASKVFTIARTFVKWLWERDALPTLPKNLNDKRHKFERPERTIPQFTNAEIKTLVTNAKGGHRLILLLMLNCGMTQKDVADLLKTEIDLDAGRITRRRSKTAKKKASRLVSYKLWPETAALLRECINTNTDEPRALTTKSGSPWVWTETTDKNRMRKSDNVATVFNNLKRKIGMNPKDKGEKRTQGKSLKVFRKTSASRLRASKEHRDLRYWFLGHSERTVADRHYSAGTQQQLDAAVDWLRTQYDL